MKKKSSKQQMKELVKVLYTEGKVIERKIFPEQYSIVEAFGQRFRIENPGGKGVKITQIGRASE